MRTVLIAQLHDIEDIRITRKEGASLVKNGIEVFYITGKKSNSCSGEEINGIKTYTYNKVNFSHNIPHITWRIEQFLYLRWVKKISLKFNADLYHIHEIGLYKIAKYLKKHGKKVIFDQHEDSPRQMFQGIMELYNNPFFAGFCQRLVIRQEKIMVKNSDYVIATSEAIANNINQYRLGKKIAVIHNYADKNTTIGNNDDYDERENIICYAGGLFARRGIKSVIDAMIDVDGVFEFAGNLDEAMRKDYEASRGWHKCKYLGMLNQNEVNDLYCRSRIGIINNWDVPYHRNSNPNKLFEYMSVGLPIVCTSIPSWAKIVQDAKCGIIVDARNPKQIAAAITYLLEHPKEAKEMGDNGRKAFEKTYNWDVDKKKLLQIYEEIGRQGQK